MTNRLEEYKRYKFMIENIKDIIWELDSNFVFTFVSPSAKDAVGYEAEEVVGKSLFDFLTPQSKELVLNQYKENTQKRINGQLGTFTVYNVEFICKDGKHLWFEVSLKPIYKYKNFVGYIGASRDVSEKTNYENQLIKYIEDLKKANKKLEKLAALDMLTGAYNRRKFENFVKLSVDKKKKYGSPFSIIMFDIDHFKQVNDRYGHKKGDQILKEISAIVKRTLRDTDKLFRWGGEEFIILLPDITLKNAYKVAEKVRESIERKLKATKVTVSLGVGEYETGDSIDHFVSCVDNALLKAKTNGRNRVAFR